MRQRGSVTTSPNWLGPFEGIERRMASSAQGKLAADLKNEIMERVRLFSGDCRTFWRVRLQQNKWFHRWGLGGGNFVMALAMFSALNFLAKAYALIFRPNAFTKKNGELRCNETDAFNWLIKALHQDGIDLGIPDSEATAVWRTFRNKLAHVAKPGSFVEVYDPKKSVSPSAAERRVRTGGPAFFKKKGHWMCNADRLSVDAFAVGDWVCKQVDACTDPARLKELSDWLFKA
jgi:hypothetical protein